MFAERTQSMESTNATSGDDTKGDEGDIAPFAKVDSKGWLYFYITLLFSTSPLDRGKHDPVDKACILRTLLPTVLKTVRSQNKQVFSSGVGNIGRIREILGTLDKNVAEQIFEGFQEGQGPSIKGRSEELAGVLQEVTGGK